MAGVNGIEKCLQTFHQSFAIAFSKCCLLEIRQLRPVQLATVLLVEQVWFSGVGCR